VSEAGDRTGKRVVVLVGWIIAIWLVVEIIRMSG
jgi:hypothetical protein